MIITIGLAIAAFKACAAAGSGGAGAWATWKWLGTQSEVQLPNGGYDQAAQFEWAGATEASDNVDALPPPAVLDEGLARGATKTQRTKLMRTMHHWVAALRIEFPARQNRPSDRAAMSKWLAGQLRDKGWRVAHIADFTPRAVALACNPSHAEHIASMEADAAVVRSATGRWIHRMRHYIGAAGGAAGASGC
jgi:hypothetical protein